MLVRYLVENHSNYGGTMYITTLEPFSKSIFLQNYSIFDLDSSTKVNFETVKVKDFYWLLNKQVNNGPHTGPPKWSKSMPIGAKQWEKFSILIKKVSRENKLREFHFKFLHRIVVTKKELCRLVLKMTVNAYILENKIR